ncbi:ROK family transcriptional regulator [Streptomyces sp. NBC_00663]|uniref:ROK family transcriptional regulator n=1 Tax=Streptomyces sp. NBC_00663 TaxID=2975801 RepID=UPI002E36E4C8|nr:ROK family transcriptional regulator [Streptomyces sp. NBC_00663]
MNRTNVGANLPALRSHNTALVLDLLRTAGGDGISRLELAERTGLTPQAVSKITGRLREEGLAAEAGRRASTGGKPRTVLRLVPEAGHAIGVHLDRDELRVVLVDLDGAVVGERCVPMNLGAGAEAVVEGVARVVEGLVAEVPTAGRTVTEVPAEGLVASSVGRGVAGGAAAETSGGGRGVAEGAAGELVAGASVVGRGAIARAAEGLPVGASGGGREVAEGLVAGVPAVGRGVVGRAAEGGRGAAAEAEAEASVSEGGVARGARAGVRVRPVLGLGVALPGPLDHVRGVLHRVTGFPEWDGFPLRDALAERLGLPVVVDKDTNAAALGLAVADVGTSFAYLHLGTGLGAGLVIGGVVHRGARTGAGEFGHQVVQLDGPVCGCGDRGCIEALCLGAVGRGDLAGAARVLGVGAANLVGLLDIDLVLLGGRTVASAPEAFVSGVRAVLEERARGAEAVPVRVAPGGVRGVAEGAAQLLLAPLFGRADG